MNGYLHTHTQNTHPSHLKVCAPSFLLAEGLISSQDSNHSKRSRPKDS